MAKQPRPFTKTEERIGSVFVKWMSAANAAVFRATGGSRIQGLGRVLAGLSA